MSRNQDSLALLRSLKVNTLQNYFFGQKRGFKPCVAGLPVIRKEPICYVMCGGWRPLFCEKELPVIRKEPICYVRWPEATEGLLCEKDLKKIRRLCFC